MGAVFYEGSMRPLLLFAIYSVAFASVTIIRATADANNPAHDLAQKFAVGDQGTTAAAQPTVQQPTVQQPQVSQPQTKRPQTTREVTAPKPAVAAPKPQAQAQTQAQTQAQAQTQPQAPAGGPRATVPKTPPAPTAKSRPPAPGADYERDMLEAARAEAQARETLQTQQAESKSPVVVPPPTPTAATAQPPATVAPPPSPPALAQATTPHVPTPQVAPQVAPQAAAPQPAPAPAPAASPQIRIEAKVNVPAPATVTRPDGAPRATILAVLTHSAHDAGRAITPPDPIICLADICYISAGPNADAKLISRSEALSTKNTVTSGAGACKGVSRCAYRGVSMQRGDEVQIIDLGLVGHDKREPADVTPDTSCRVEDGDLLCDQPVAAPDYRIWVVPETVAAAAGPGAIEHALADDLPEEDIARAEDK